MSWVTWTSLALALLSAGCTFDDDRACASTGDCGSVDICYRGFCIDPAYVPRGRLDSGLDAGTRDSPDAATADARELPLDAHPDRAVRDEGAPPPDVAAPQDGPAPPDAALPDAAPPDGPLPDIPLPLPPPPDAGPPVVPGVPGCNFGLVCVPSSDDTFIDEDNPEQDFAAAGEIEIRAGGRDGEESIGLLRFDLAAFPRGLRVESAALNLYVVWASGEGDGRPQALTIDVRSHEWVEPVTWDSPPPSIGVAVVAAHAFRSSERAVLDVTELVEAALREGVPAFAFGLSTPGRGFTAIDFGSSESRMAGSVYPWLEFRFVDAHP